MTEQPPRDHLERFERTEHVDEMLQVRPRPDHDAEQRQLLERRSQPRHLLAQSARIVGRGIDHAATLRGTRHVRMIVRPVGLDREGQARLLQERDHLRRLVEEGIDTGGVEPVARRVLEVGPRRLAAVGQSQPLRDGIVGNPDAAAGDRRGAAVERRLLEDDDRQALQRRGDGGRQAAGAAADDDDVTDVVIRHES